MNILEGNLQEFIDIVEDETGKRITAEEASHLAQKLLHLYETLYSPMPGEKSPPSTA